MSRRFNGFVVATEPAVGVPRAFFVDVLPQLQDPAEIHVTLTAFRLAADGGGIETPISEDALLRDRPLRSALRVVGSPREPDHRIGLGLDLAVGRGTLLRFASEHAAERRVWYYVNTPVNQALVAAMARGAVAPPMALWHDDAVPTVEPERPNVFRLYEQNIGLLTPLIADHIVDALETYPVEWIEDGIAEAVTYNRRSWRYVQRILEKWATEGRGAGVTGTRER
ncbi:MAG: DnaD domain protein [Chloroflexota bacterium]|nr:DnaD domain protein [Chloroflexota bacterium]